jgi:hypothetical protein
VGARNRPERRKGVVHFDDVHTLFARRAPSLHDDKNRTGCNRGVHIRMAVVARTSQSDERNARRNRATVGRDARRDPAVPTSHYGAADRTRDL